MQKRGLAMTALMIGVLLVGTGATIALTGESSPKQQNAAKHQYGPPHGCGPKKHGHQKPCKPRCNKARNGGKGRKKRPCRVEGTNGGDRMRGTHRPDRIRGRGGRDIIRVRGGGRDRVSCGRGHDTVYAGRNDRVSGDCEDVRRKR